jgi:hypothetical protein
MHIKFGGQRRSWPQIALQSPALEHPKPELQNVFAFPHGIRQLPSVKHVVPFSQQFGPQQKLSGGSQHDFEPGGAPRELIKIIKDWNLVHFHIEAFQHMDQIALPWICAPHWNSSRCSLANCHSSSSQLDPALLFPFVERQ